MYRLKFDCFDLVADFAQKLSKCVSDFIVSDLDLTTLGQCIEVKSPLHALLEGMKLKLKLYMTLF